jgi:HemY protein
MRRFMGWLVVLLGSLSLIAYLIRAYPGYLLVLVGPYRLESTVVTAVSLWLLLWILLLAVVRLLGKLVCLPGWLRRYRRSRAQKQFQDALLKAVEGDYLEAATGLVRSASSSEQPELHYLLAAEAARQQENWDLVKRYLSQIACRPDQPYWLALQISWARVQLATQPIAISTLSIDALLRLAPKHPAVRQLAQQLEQQAGVRSELSCNAL